MKTSTCVALGLGACGLYYVNRTLACRDFAAAVASEDWELAERHAEAASFATPAVFASALLITMVVVLCLETGLSTDLGS